VRDKILIVDDEPNITSSFSALLKDHNYRTETAASAEDALRHVERSDFSLILLDLNLPGESGIDFLRQLRSQPGSPHVLVISGQSDIPTALQAVKLGAIDYLEKPVAAEKLISAVRSAMMLVDAERHRNLMVADLDDRTRISGRSKAVRKLLDVIDQIAPTDSTVLVTGENGTGKELVATRIFLQSDRRDKPFIKVNCPGIPETLFESELFGHSRGAFTGAVKDYPGKFKLADGGTIFLDEIGDLPVGCQAKLLRVLETGEVETLGAVSRQNVNVRVICATNRDLPRLVNEGKFREDLYYRISVLVVPVPPLRERREDIPALAGEFLRRFDPGRATNLSPEAISTLSTLDYPGNVRQLKNVIERLTILSAGRTIESDDVLAQSHQVAPGGISLEVSTTLPEKLRLFEKQLIERALDENGGNISAAARALKVDRANLSKKIKELGLKLR